MECSLVRGWMLQASAKARNRYYTDQMVVRDGLLFQEASLPSPWSVGPPRWHPSWHPSWDTPARMHPFPTWAEDPTASVFGRETLAVRCHHPSAHPLPSARMHHSMRAGMP